MFALTTLKTTFLDYFDGFRYFVYLNYMIEQQILITAVFNSINAQMLETKIKIGFFYNSS